MRFFIIALFASLVFAFASETAYTASFSADGSDGYFSLKISSSGFGVYQYLLDFTNFTTSCDLSAGLTYHLHTYWTDVERTSTTTCGTAGGHYDPYLACGTSSEDKAGLCVGLNRTASQGYSYGCNPSDYAAGFHASCEVGDFSGKFGRMMPSAAASRVFKADIVDPNPPLSVNYVAGDAVGKQWASVVVHCPADNARLICAQLIRNKCSSNEKC